MKDFKLTLGGLSLLALMLIILLTAIQRPTPGQLHQSILQGQHQSEANYWRK